MLAVLATIASLGRVDGFAPMPRGLALQGTRPRAVQPVTRVRGGLRLRYAM